MWGNARRKFPALPSYWNGEPVLILFERIDSTREATISEAFTVATCARELGDMVAATCALRVIDELLHKRQPCLADVALVKSFFEPKC
jgi:hypothetical protein